MTLLYYNSSSDVASGKVFVSDIISTYRFEAWDKLIADYNDADISVFGVDVALVVRLRAFLKIKNFGSAYPFTSTPEVRYKIGTYVPFPGYEVIITEFGTEVYPYQDTPQFLLYERQSLPEFRAFIPLAVIDALDYSVTMAASSTIDLNANIHDATQDFFSFQGLPTLIGFDINLNDGITADLEVYYTWFTYPFSSSEARTKVQITF